MSQLPPENPYFFSTEPQPPHVPKVRLEAVGDAWNLVKDDFGPWVLGIILIVVVSTFVTIPIRLVGSAPLLTPGAQPPSFAQIFSPAYFATAALSIVISSAISSAGYAQLQRFGLAKLRGYPVNLSDIFTFKPLDRYGRVALYQTGFTVVAVIIFGAAATLLMPDFFTNVFPQPGKPFPAKAEFGPGAGLFLLLELAGFVAYALLYFVPLLLVDQGVSIGTAIQTSVRVSLANFFPLIGVMILSGLFVSLGFLACCVGILFTLPIHFAVVSVMFNDLFPQQARAMQGNEGPPPVQRW